MLRVVLAVLALSFVSGCQFGARQAGYCDDCVPPPIAGKYWYQRHIDNRVTSLTAQRCAHRDLKSIKQQCGPVTPDFKDGYTQAYIDLAVGRPACVPAVPPPKYWHAWYRSCGGSGGVEEWYAGYRSGLEFGVNGGVNHFNRIIPSPDGCCVSAAYVSPYAVGMPADAVPSPNTQTISQEGLAAETAPLAADEQPVSETPQSSDNWPDTQFASGPPDVPITP